MEAYIEPFVFLTARVILGTLFFFQAYDKIFKLKLKNVSSEVKRGTDDRKIPSWFSSASVKASSFLELISGVLLISGLFTLPVLFILGIHLMLLTLAFSYLEGLWDMRHIFPRLTLLFLLLLLPQEWNIWSLDFLFF